MDGTAFRLAQRVPASSIACRADDGVGSLGQLQEFLDGYEQFGNEPHGTPGHSLPNAVEDVTTTFVGQGRRALATQRMGSFKELIEHFWNLFLVEVKERFRI